MQQNLAAALNNLAQSLEQLGTKLKPRDIATQAKVIHEKQKIEPNKTYAQIAQDLGYQNSEEIERVMKSWDQKLIQAIMDKDSKKVQENLAKGANPNAQDKYTTALGFAASFVNKEIIKMLIEAGADIDREDPTMSTPLRVAISLAKIENVKVLVDHGAKSLGSGLLDMSPLQYAKDNLKLVNEVLAGIGNTDPILKEFMENKVANLKKIVDFLQKETQKDPE